MGPLSGSRPMKDCLMPGCAGAAPCLSKLSNGSQIVLKLGNEGHCNWAVHTLIHKPYTHFKTLSSSRRKIRRRRRRRRSSGTSSRRPSIGVVAAKAEEETEEAAAIQRRLAATRFKVSGLGLASLAPHCLLLKSAKTGCLTPPVSWLRSGSNDIMAQPLEP